jgi:murein endopeptidase
MDYINTSHPSFVGGSKAVEMALQDRRSSKVVEFRLALRLVTWNHLTTNPSRKQLESKHIMHLVKEAVSENDRERAMLCVDCPAHFQAVSVQLMQNWSARRSWSSSLAPRWSAFQRLHLLLENLVCQPPASSPLF